LPRPASATSPPGKATLREPAQPLAANRSRAASEQFRAIPAPHNPPGDVMQNYSFACTRSACGDCCLLPELTFGEIPDYLDKCILGLRWHLYSIDPVYSFHEEGPLTKDEHRHLVEHMDSLGYPKMTIAGIPAVLDVVPIMTNVYKKPFANDIICPFLEPDKTCRIYDDRPLSCRCMPFSRRYPVNMQYYPLKKFRRHHDCLRKCLHKRIPHIYGDETFLDPEYATNYNNYIHEIKAGMHINIFMNNLIEADAQVVPSLDELKEILVYKMWLNTSLLPYLFMGFCTAKISRTPEDKARAKFTALEMIRIQTEVTEREIKRTLKVHPDITNERIQVVRDLTSCYSFINEIFEKDQ
jgi:Fe-S-cluster containining protein